MLFIADKNFKEEANEMQKSLFLQPQLGHDRKGAKLLTVIERK